MNTAPNWGPIGEEVYRRTYSRTKADGTQEAWPETVARTVAGNLALVGPQFIGPGEGEALTELLLGFKALPAGRHLWASGADTTLGLFNCHRAGWGTNLSEHFTFTFEQLMLGGGVGANYSSSYLEALPPVLNSVKLSLQCSPKHPDLAECSPFLAAQPAHRVDYVVEDSREGWITALRLVINAHLVGVNIALCLDVTQVRPRGWAIKGFGGIASGPGPLLDMLTQVNALLNGVKPGGKLSPLMAMYIDHAIATCVISGNVRRSARMSMMHWQDPAIMDFINCKSTPGAHWSTNISVEIDDNFLDYMAEFQDGQQASSQLGAQAQGVFNAVTRGMLLNGEPGFYNSDHAAQGERPGADVRCTNPCGEIALEEWEQCCLGHVNLAAFPDDVAGARDAFWLMTRYLVRATFAKASDPKQQDVKDRNRRIGVGFFGFQEWCTGRGVAYSDAALDNSISDKLKYFADAVRLEAHLYALELGIPTPIKTTTIAPTGSIAKLPGTSEGIHPIFARHFIRRVRYSDNDPLLEALSLKHAIEPDVYSAGTSVVSFICRDSILDHAVSPELVESVDQLSLDELFSVQAMVQANYADNAVSFTANISSSTTIEELRAALHRWLPEVKGTTVMPEVSMLQMPYERISEDAYYSAAMQEVGQSIDECLTGACPVR